MEFDKCVGCGSLTVPIMSESGRISSGLSATVTGSESGL